jgi:hypothetical protein
MDAANNAAIIQSNVNLIGTAGGGTVLLPAGTYYLSQAYPDEEQSAWSNAAVSIVTNNIEIAGAGKTNTTLVAYNRATTIFSLGREEYSVLVQCTNFTLRDMTLEAQPHLAVANLTNTTLEPGELLPNDYTGTLTYLDGFYTSFSCNLLFTNCQFLYGNVSILIEADVSNCLITHCDFNIWGGSNIYTGATNNPPTNTLNTAGHSGSVGIFCSGTPSYNINILENTYNGNTNLVPNTNNPFGYVSTNSTQVLAPDGFVYFQSGGNYFIARNTILNYALEAVQLSAGPNSVVGNTYNTLISAGACCAVAVNNGGFEGLTGFDALNYSTCFIGNSVYGGRNGNSFQGEGSVPVYALNFSGNYLTLYPAFPQADYPGAVVALQNYTWANVFGNTLVSGGEGVAVASESGHAAIMNNNFANVTYCGIGTEAGGSLQSATIINNLLGEGATFHVQLPFADSFGWFLYQNQYFNAAGNSVPLFIDPASSAVHISD